MTIALTPTGSSLPAIVTPGSTVTTTFRFTNSAGSDSGAILLTFTDANGSQWTINWTTNTLDAVTLSGSAGPLNAGGTTPFSPPTISSAISTTKFFSGTITSVVPLTWTSGDYVSTIVASGVGLTASSTVTGTSHVIGSVFKAPTTLPPMIITQGRPIIPFALTATGGQTPYTFTQPAAIPPGLVVDSVTGIVSGTPTTIGVSSPKFTITDNLSETQGTIIKITVVADADIVIIEPPPYVEPHNQLRCPTQQFWVAGVPIPSGLAVALHTSNDLTKPIAYTATGLPKGITLNSSTGVFSGTPTLNQNAAPIVVTATDALGVQEVCGFEVAIRTYAADAADVVGGPVISSSLPACTAYGYAGGIAAQPTLTSIITNSTAAMAAAYPP